MREQFLGNVQNYFQSSTTGKGGIDLLALSRPACIDIYTDNNDYLGLSFDPRLKVPTAERGDESSSPSSLIHQDQKGSMRRPASDNVMSGIFLQADCLQDQVSKLFAREVVRKESVYLAQSGYAANFGALQTIVIPSVTHVYIDASAHESLWQGASRGIIHKIKHNSLADLESKLRVHGSGIIVVDSLYSSMGSIANLVAICDLKDKYDCMLLVDESHSIGLYGPDGQGLAALANVTDRIDLITGSLAKAYCVRAGFIAGRAQEILYIREQSSSSIFSSALMTWDLQRLQQMIEIIQNATSQRQRLMDISRTIRHAAVALQYDVEEPILSSPILCLKGGPNLCSKKLQALFEDAGISGAIFISPATPINRSILRLTLHAALSDQDVARIIDTLTFIAAHHRRELPHTFKPTASA